MKNKRTTRDRRPSASRPPAVGERRRSLADVSRNSSEFRDLYEEAPVGYHEIDLQGRITRVNRTQLEMLDYTVDEMLGRHVWEFIHPNEAARQAIQAKIAGSIPLAPYEGSLIKRNGTLMPALLQERHIRDGNSRITGIRATVLDMTELKCVETQILQSDSHDPLTGLLSREFFHRKVTGRLVERIRRRKNYLFALLHIGLDRFRTINESLGQAAGDRLLSSVGHLLHTLVRPEDTVARLGEDRFGILLHDIKDVRDAMRVSDRILKKLAVPFELAGKKVSVGASIGIALSAAGYETAEDLLHDAGAAMSRAKANGGASCQVFDTAQHARAMALLQLEAELRHAIERSEFRAYYQPIVSVVTGRITGFEALVRWQHPDRGLVLPAEFIPIAEETGLIVPIGSWVLRQACQQIRSWQEKFPSNPPLYVTVNFSARQFTQSGLIEQIDQILRETAVDASSLGLEITESMILECVESTASTLAQLSSRKIRLYVDDFGTGYSSLSHLHRFPIDTLKIDRSFVSGMGTNSENLKTIRAILGLAANFDMKVTVEGVETAAQMAQLKALKCTEVQGFYFSRPVDAQAAEALLAQQKSSSGVIRFEELLDARPVVSASLRRVRGVRRGSL
ncbi:MAG TPA: EAL domain-containing protein [Acidobacteriota bacterium]|nr:EAL domain-containing protein [Acidobacteriota bacterium]